MQENISRARSRESNRRDGVFSHLPPGLSAESVHAQVEKILSSRIFANSKRLVRFLRYTIERTIHGEMDKIKEFLLGIEVFDRRESFDPRIDSIVRVEARRLRSRLQKYYETEGAEDPIVIQFPKGTYVPDFVSRKPCGLLPASSEPGKPPQAEWKTIAVLPFADLSPEKDQEYFCDGMTEELINVLSKVTGLKVVAPI